MATVIGIIVLAFLPRAVEVDLEKVTRGPILLTVDEDGTTRVRERYIISAPLTGRLLRVEFDPGDSIEKGQLLATLDPSEPNLLDPRLRAQAEAREKSAQASLMRAQSQLESTRVEADMFEKTYARSKILFEKGSLRKAALEEAECHHLGGQLAIRSAISSVNIATFDLEQAEAALLHASSENNEQPEGRNFHIHSPCDGCVLRVFQQSSTVVAPGARLIEIGDPSDLELRIDVLSQDAVKIRPGQRVALEHWGGAKPLTARIRRVEPSAYTKVSALGVDEQRVNVIADLESAPEKSEVLGDGFRVEARIVIWESEDSLRLPAGALFRANGSWAVYRKRGNRAELIPIEVGHNNGNEVEILSGLTENAQVILHPSDQVQDGVLIKSRS